MSYEEWTEVETEHTYAPESIQREGFIHCATIEQTENVANRFFKGHSGLVLLCIDTERLKSELVYEDLEETGKLYPHIYGSLNVDAVVETMPFEPEEDGTFVLPKEIKSIG